MTPASSGPIVLVDLTCAEPASSAAAYQRLLDRPVVASAAEDQRFAVRVGNTALHLGASERESSAGTGEHGVYFIVDDSAAVGRLLARRNHPVTPSPLGLIGDRPRLGVVDREAQTIPRDGPAVRDGDLTGLDHLVFTCGSRDAAVALFAGTFDLDFRLDQRIATDSRQLFFRRGDLIVEVVATPDPQPAAEPSVVLWGVAWRSADVDASHARLTEAGFDLSDVRTGRKRGTRIFTVRDRELATRTVVIGPAD
ncbi:VOC family protein [Gordonia terrae]|uniref:VOC family protein n=1 Tax=Gordonia terrae TaxID=2055 RepID=UPI003F6D1D8B